jgi:hypothetical protein
VSDAPRHRRRPPLALMVLGLLVGGLLAYREAAFRRSEAAFARVYGTGH